MPQKHIIHFYDDINCKSFQALHTALLQIIAENSNSEIIILLSSKGGSLDAGFDAYNFIRNLPIPITCINMGTVESAAVIVFLAAERRFALKDSRFLLHSFHWDYSNDGTVDHNRVIEHVNSLNFDRDRYASVFNERTKAVDAGFDITECLNGVSKILNSDDAANIGLTTLTANDVEFPIMQSGYRHWLITQSPMTAGQ